MKKANFLSDRAWLLMLLEAAEHNGLFPVAFTQLHRYVYLANVLSPVCDMTMPESYTLKNMRGPYFPTAQWDMGRLVVQQLVEVADIKPFNDEYGFWLRANYRITEKGISLVSSLFQYEQAIEQSDYLREFMRACNTVTSEELDLMAEHDLHYSHVNDGNGVHFGETEGNVSKQAILLMFPEERSITPREGMHRYMAYLQTASGSLN